MEEFPGYYKTADAGFIDEDGYVFVMSRTDDIINVAGHRLSTGGMEEVLADHPDVAECAVLGVDDPLKGQVPLGFLVLNAGVEREPDDIIKEVIQMVRDRIGPVASFRTATVVKRLPKTRSGKILRGTIQKIADNKPYKAPATIEECFHSMITARKIAETFRMVVIVLSDANLATGMAPFKRPKLDPDWHAQPPDLSPVSVDKDLLRIAVTNLLSLGRSRFAPACRRWRRGH